MAGKRYKAEYDLKSKNLQLRGRVWFYRKAVPAELRERMGCNEITRSLGTESVTEAEQAAVLMGREVTALIEGARADRLLDVEALVSKLSGKFFTRLLATDRHDRRAGHFGFPKDFDEVSSALIDQAEVVEEELNRRRFDSVRAEAAALLETESIQLNPEELEGLLHELLTVQLRARAQTIRELSASPTFKPLEPIVAPPEPTAAAAPPAAKEAGRPLSAVVDAYVAERTASGDWTNSRAAGERVAQLGWLLDKVGADTPVDAVTPANIMDARTALTKEGRSSGTVGKIIGTWTALFNWCEKRREITYNPSRGMRPTRKKSKSSRQPFTDEELGKLFSAPLRKASLDKDRPERWWVCLLALHTGARIGELAQLETFDVKLRDGIDFLDITEEANNSEGKTYKVSLKNEGSEREVPIHPELIRLGFLDYVETRRAHQCVRLFPEARQVAGRGAGSQISAWFTTYRKKIGVSKPGRTFHCFRNTVSNRLYAAGIEEAAVAQLLGHTHATMAFGKYGGELSLERLAEIVALLDFKEPLRSLLES